MKPKRIQLMQITPELCGHIEQLDEMIGAFATQSGIAAGFSQLLKLRASQINECAFCVRMHTRDALAAGESSDRVALVAAWRESEYFDAKERASLMLIEALTRLTDDHMSDEVYDEAATVLTGKEIAAVEWIGMMINMWNRLAISNRLTVRP
jgi:AhpD family alkylhydroperoxidase